MLNEPKRCPFCGEPTVEDSDLCELCEQEITREEEEAARVENDGYDPDPDAR